VPKYFLDYSLLEIPSFRTLLANQKEIIDFVPDIFFFKKTVSAFGVFEKAHKISIKTSERKNSRQVESG